MDAKHPEGVACFSLWLTQVEATILCDSLQSDVDVMAILSQQHNGEEVHEYQRAWSAILAQLRAQNINPA